MTKLIIETDNTWTREKIKSAIFGEIDLLKRTADKIRLRLADFEGKYGPLDRQALYGKVDDMELVEWEGELETFKRLEEKLKSLEEITFEYK